MPLLHLYTTFSKTTQRQKNTPSERPAPPPPHHFSAFLCAFLMAATRFLEQARPGREEGSERREAEAQVLRVRPSWRRLSNLFGPCLGLGLWDLPVRRPSKIHFQHLTVACSNTARASLTPKKGDYIHLAGAPCMRPSPPLRVPFRSTRWPAGRTCQRCHV